VHSRKVIAGIVSALGITQIIGYGTLYYYFSILAPGMAAGHASSPIGAPQTAGSRAGAQTSGRPPQQSSIR